MELERNSMKSTIVFIVFSILFYVLYKFLKKISTNNPFESSVRNAIIDKVVYTENHNTRYYVSFETEKGDLLRGKSIAYAITKHKYKERDNVEIQYFINKSGDARVKILDNELVPCSVSGVKGSKFCLFISIVFLLLGIANLCFY